MYMSCIQFKYGGGVALCMLCISKIGMEHAAVDFKPHVVCCSHVMIRWEDSSWFSVKSMADFVLTMQNTGTLGKEVETAANYWRHCAQNL